MDDLTITKRCAERIGIVHLDGLYPAENYDPLNDKAKAMALVEKFELCIQPPIFDKKRGWHVWKEPKPNCTATGFDLLRCICECVAKMEG